MSYLSSRDVSTAWPAARRTSDHVVDKIQSETAITRLVKSLSPNSDGNIILTEGEIQVTETGDQSFLEFCCDGYYFKIDLSGVPSGSRTGSLYVKVDKEPLTGYYSSLEEIKGDNGNDSQFEGLIFSDNQSGMQMELGTWTTSEKFTPNSGYYKSTAYKPYFLSDEGPSSPTVQQANKLWIGTGSTDGDVIHYWNGTTWVKLGAVFK